MEAGEEAVVAPLEPVADERQQERLHSEEGHFHKIRRYSKLEQQELAEAKGQITCFLLASDFARKLPDSQSRDRGLRVLRELEELRQMMEEEQLPVPEEAVVAPLGPVVEKAGVPLLKQVEEAAMAQLKEKLARRDKLLRVLLVEVQLGLTAVVVEEEAVEVPLGLEVVALLALVGEEVVALPALVEEAVTVLVEMQPVLKVVVVQRLDLRSLNCR
jgi:hypothetical protein